MQALLDKNIANALQVDSSRAEAGSGLSLSSLDPPELLAKGTALCRVGHGFVRRHQIPDTDNFLSPWWILAPDFQHILGLGQRDPSWAARVALAIAEQWGGDCRFEVRATLAEPLYAWKGQGRVISKNRVARAVMPSDPTAYWFPDASIWQLFIPGLKYCPRGRANALWFTALQQREIVPLLMAGNQLNLQLGRPFASKMALPPCRRPGSV